MREDAVRYHEEAMRSLDEDRRDDALVLLTFALEHDPGYRPPYELSIEILEAVGNLDEASLFETALESFDDGRTFYHLGYHFFDQGNTRLAVPFLERSNRLRPGQPDTIIALGIALGAEGRFRTALARLRTHPERETQFWPFYETAYAEFLLGRTSSARRRLDRILKRIDAFRTTVAEEELLDFDAAIDRLDCGLRRHGRVADRCDRSIRDWHFIQYGGIVLDLHDDRHAPSAAGLAGGRYLALWSSPSTVRGVLGRLVELLGDLELVPNVVLHGPEHDDHALALALGRLLDRPVEAIDDRPDREDALVVVATTDGIDDLPELAEREPGEIFFSYWLPWTRDALVVPDVAGLLAQYHLLPWHEADTPDVELAYDLPADPRTPEELAGWIVAAPPAPPPTSWAADRSFFGRHRSDLAVDDWLRRPRRDRFLTNSPVPGWRYV